MSDILSKEIAKKTGKGVKETKAKKPPAKPKAKTTKAKRLMTLDERAEIHRHDALKDKTFRVLKLIVAKQLHAQIQNDAKDKGLDLSTYVEDILLQHYQTKEPELVKQILDEHFSV